jgi:hypothetical protein
MNEARDITKGFMASWIKNIVSNKLFFFWKCLILGNQTIGSDEFQKIIC